MFIHDPSHAGRRQAELKLNQTKMNMKAKAGMKTKFKLKLLTMAAGLSAALLATALVVRAQDPGTNAAPSAAGTSKPVPYPLDYCVVSGEKFGGDMGDPVVFVYTNNGMNQEIKFCCPMCKPKFLKDPATYLKPILAAEAAQKK